MEPRRTWCAISVIIALSSAVTGCKRSFYKRTADRDAYCLLEEKGQGPTWRLQPGFTIETDPRSRLPDPPCEVDPRLPVPAPQLYNYELPELVTQAPKPREIGGDAAPDRNLLPVGPNTPAEEIIELPAAPSTDGMPQFDGESETPGAPATPQLEPTNATSAYRLRSLSPPAEPVGVVVASAQAAVIPDGIVTAAEPLSDSATDENSYQRDSAAPAEQTDAEAEEIPMPLPEFGQAPQLAIAPVPQSAWQSLPDSCLKRMLEFDTVRDEYERSFGREVTESQLDSAKRVNLENILEIALINSREYQTRKETLYRVALRLSLRRFDFDLRFLPRGNGTGLNYTHDRVAGVEVNRLGVPTGLGITRSLYTGGDLVARFANDVVLTFNGPTGYTSSVGSEIFVDLFQPIMQRDVQFEPLTQAERDVVYAARDFVRFRKILFRDLAAQYYSLLLTYRGIAINTQDYFSNLREFIRAAATEQAGQIPLVQVDQFEQNVLRSRGNLINSCNSLEGALDRLKIRIGLPTEMPLNLAITELEELTLADEASVLREELKRKTRVFLQKQEQDGTADALSALTEVARRMLNLAAVNERLGATQDGRIADLEKLVALLEVEEKRAQARENESLLKASLNPGPGQSVLPAQIFLRSNEVIQNTLEAVRQELVLLSLVAAEASAESAAEASAASELPPSTAQARHGSLATAIRELTERWRAQVAGFVEVEQRLDDIPSAEKADLYPRMNEEARQALTAAQALDADVLELLSAADIEVAQSVADLEALVATVMALESQIPEGIGLAALNVDVDEAMLTALVQRLDLMNRRGEVADAWRNIKYAGDDLRSILNLRATQSIRTRTGSKNPFDFTFDDSTTRLNMEFDTPLNRRAERNIFRLALVDYNVALRNLMEAEDNIKLDIRDDLRAIELDRNQYEIAIASAALAYDRVTSTRMQVALGAGNVSARDFLEAQQAYTQSLSAVAQQHIGYIVDRIQFFLDLEQLQVDAVNFWPDLRNEEYPFIPQMDYARVAPHPYGLLPEGPWYSRCILRQERVPPGTASINRPRPAEPSGQPTAQQIAE